MIRIRQAGFWASFVDAGRKHAQSRGYSQSGALDALSFNYANALLGQSLNRAAIEVTAGHFACEFNAPCFIVVTGADAELSINGKAFDINTVIYVKSGQYLKIVALRSGLINYIGIKAKLRFSLDNDLSGNISDHLFAGSVCAVAREKTGGIHKDGSALREKDLIDFTSDHVADACLNAEQLSDIALSITKTSAVRLSPMLLDLLNAGGKSEKKIPFSLAYQANLFSAQQLTQFFNSRYTISKHIDRMGMRLQGKALVCDTQTLASQGITFGAVQVAGDGQPIIMRNDRQTIGGYPIIGSVSKLGMAILGQATSGQEIVFMQTDFETSRQKSILVQIELQNLSTLCARLFKTPSRSRSTE